MLDIESHNHGFPILLLNGKLFCMLATLLLLPSLICTFQCASGLLVLSDRDPNS